MKYIKKVFSYIISFLLVASCLTSCDILKSEYGNTDQPINYNIDNIPQFVEDSSQFVDIRKEYVLPDGYIYEYASKFVPSAENKLSVSTDFDGKLYNECGYLNNSRLRSTLEIVDENNSFVTGFIPVKPGDILYFNGECFNSDYSRASSLNFGFYDSNREMIDCVAMSAAFNELLEIVETNSSGDAKAIKINEGHFSDNLAYIRLTLIGSGNDQIISVNEPLDRGHEEFCWSRTEEYISADWCEEIKQTIDSINDIDLKDKSTAVKFLLSSDIHFSLDRAASYTASIGKVSAEIMNECKIPFFIDAGDISTQSSGHVPLDMEECVAGVLAQLSPIPQKNLLFTVGNHDGATGSAVDENGEKIYYRHQLSHDQRSSVYFDWQRKSNSNKHFDADGTYYYLDDPSTKTRYIMLNSFWSNWEGSTDSFVEDIKQSFFHSPIFGAQQLQWFAETALDMPKNYAAVIVTHNAEKANDFEVFKGIVDAYSNQSSYIGSYKADKSSEFTNISVDFNNVTGEIIAVFQGHNHVDAQKDVFDKVPCINLTTTGAYWDVRDEDAMERVKGTSSEFAVDVVVIDKASKTIYMIRLGAGNDRVIKY